MLCRDFMPRAHNAALEQGERRFDCVGVNVTVRVFPRMIDCLVDALLHLVEGIGVDSRFIGQNDFHVAANVRIDNLLDGLRLGILSPDQPQVSIALANADNDRYVALWPPTAFLASHVGFVNLNRAAELFRRYFQHCRAYPMAEVPRRLIANPERALNLAGAHALLGLAE